MKKLLLFALMMFSISLYAQVPTLGLVASYPFTNNAQDVSGNNFHGVNHGASLTTDRFGASNSAYNFSSSGYIDYNNILNSVLSGANKKFSISFWIKPSTSNPMNIIIAKHADGGCSANERQFFIRQYYDKINVEYFGNNAGTAGRFICGTTSLSNTSKWYHIVVTYDGTVNTNDGLDRVVIYIDDQLEQTNLFCRSQSGSFPFDLTPSTAHFAVGNYLNSNGTPCLSNSSYNGAIDDIRIYNRVLNTSDINTLFFETNISGIRNFQADKNINIYPNPTTSQLNIDFGNQDLSKVQVIKITNTLGQIVFMTPVHKKSQVISTANWTGKGVYFAHTLNEKGNIISVKKILVE